MVPMFLHAGFKLNFEIVAHMKKTAVRQAKLAASAPKMVRPCLSSISAEKVQQVVSTKSEHISQALHRLAPDDICFTC